MKVAKYICIALFVLTLTGCPGISVDSFYEDSTLQEISLTEDNRSSGEVVVYLPTSISRGQSAEDLTTHYIIWAHTNTDNSRYIKVEKGTEKAVVKAPVGELTVTVLAIGKNSIVEQWERIGHTTSTKTIQNTDTIYGVGSSVCEVTKGSSTSVDIVLKEFQSSLALPDTSCEDELYRGSVSYSVIIPDYELPFSTVYVYFLFENEAGNTKEYPYGGSFDSLNLGVGSKSENNLVFTKDAVFYSGYNSYNGTETYKTSIARDNWKMKGIISFSCLGHDFYLIDHGKRWLESNICQIGAPLGNISANISWE